MWIFTGPGKDNNQLINLGNVTRILMESVEGCEQPLTITNSAQWRMTEAQSSLTKVMYS